MVNHKHIGSDFDDWAKEEGLVLEPKQYAKRDPIQLEKAGGYYTRHLSAMTNESLHSKSDIAAELAYRDYIVDMLGHDQTKCPNCSHCVKSLRQDIALRNVKIKELEAKIESLENYIKELE